MDIKSKKYHKLAVGIIVLIILLPSLAMMFIRPHYLSRQKDTGQITYGNTRLLTQLVNDSYVLYGEEVQRSAGTEVSPFKIFFSDYGRQVLENMQASQTQDEAESLSENTETEASSLSEDTGTSVEETTPVSEETETGTDVDPTITETFQNIYSGWQNSLSSIRSYIEYEVIDTRNNTILDSNYSLADSDTSLYASLDSIQDNGVLLADSDYAFVAILKYGEGGKLESTSFLSCEKDNSSQALNEIAREDPKEDLTSALFENYGYDFSEESDSLDFRPPQNRLYCFAMTNTSLEAFSAGNPGVFYTSDVYQAGTDLLVLFLTFAGIVAASALLLPFVKILDTGQEKIFCIPFEPVCLISFCVLSIASAVTADPYVMSRQMIRGILVSIGLNQTAATIIQYLWGLLGWVLIFAVCYWTFGCFRQIFTMGFRQYLHRRILIYRFWPWITKWCRRIYHGLLHIDLRDNASRILLRLVLINFIILGFISLLWFWGLAALIVYSVILFILLRKYVRKIQDQYQLLLQATNELARGNLNGTVPEDLGVFEPFREEIDKIRSGFRKAVDEEVKSTKMKTDLITNVSHDLKTPLTAIITYVDLLKKPDLSKETQEKYIRILDQKANRLKLLIEDLFEISKATSKTVQLNIMDVDIVSLLRQVKLELQDKIDATDLYFRWQLPEKKVILPLDSQRTYRVFENLLVNITKYAMPHTRVYITMEDTENHVKVSMKNISATELNFNPSEITERFVRGDTSRNTEGSGLGLAIAKSFTELQGGRLEVFTDADLFTVEITFLKSS